MDPTETVEEYYEALRRDEPLAPYFAEREDVVKFGVSERLAGYEAVAEGLREQTKTTEDWRVESDNLRVTHRDSVAWFTDDVVLAWTDSTGDRKSFDTRWSGVLERGDRSSGGTTDGDPGGTTDGGSGGIADTRWRFVQMHVSAPHDR